ncbi:MAG: hypothetical protein ACTSX7_18825 [Alphaproteobacteria bacterium]
MRRYLPVLIVALVYPSGAMAQIATTEEIAAYRAFLDEPHEEGVVDAQIRFGERVCAAGSSTAGDRSCAGDFSTCMNDLAYGRDSDIVRRYREIICLPLFTTFNSDQRRIMVELSRSNVAVGATETPLPPPRTWQEQAERSQSEPVDEFDLGGLDF